MAVDIKNLIAAISPDIFCESVPSVKSNWKSPRVEVKKALKAEYARLRRKADDLKRDGKEIKKDHYKTNIYLKLAGKNGPAKLRDADYMDVHFVRHSHGAFDFKGQENPIEKHKLTYDAFSQNLEPIYFWILDYVNQMFKGGSEKLIDNFVSSAGSGHFAEMQARATRMQEEGMKIMQTSNALIRSVLNLIYDMKEWKLKLAPYESLKSKNEMEKRAAILSLKQSWMDNVDIKRQTTSIKGFAQQPEYVTIIDAFLAAGSLDHLKDLDLNERVKRILIQRYAEFEKWIEESEDQLKKRYEVEKIYLRSQVNSLRMYSRWAKPYLKAARQLEQNLGENAEIITNFNTAVFELVLLAKLRYSPDFDIQEGVLPEAMKKMKFREYIPFTLIEFKFRSIPDREQSQQGGYSFRGRAEVTFTSFVLNKDELDILKEQIEEDDFADVFKMVEGATDESLGKIHEDLVDLLDEEKAKEKKDEKKYDDSNPFTALKEIFKKKEPKYEKFAKGVPEDSYYEKAIRDRAIFEARWRCRKLYDEYKKTHGMPSFPPVIFT
jgi:hypothetical protein